jgi:hypothetical protein
LQVTLMNTDGTNTHLTNKTLSISTTFINVLRLGTGLWSNCR